MRAWRSGLAAALIAVLLATSAASAKTVEVNDPNGGLVMWYQYMWSKLGAENVSVRIAGPCVSACTILLGYIPRDRICVTPNASLGFHAATMQFATEDLWQAYPADIRSWINEHGGLTRQLIYLQGPTLFKFFHKCSA
jgi:hypothetical protein